MMDRGDICKAPGFRSAEVTPPLESGVCVCAALCLVDVPRLGCVCLRAGVYVCTCVP